MASYYDSSAALKLKPFKSSAGAILKELSNRQVLEEDFLPDPAGFMAVRLHGRLAARISRARLNSANKLLFSLMANDDFVDWLKTYQEQALKAFEEDDLAIIDKSKIRLDFAKAMAKFGDADIINAALVGNVPQYVPQDPWDVIDVIGNIGGRPDLPVIQTVIQTTDLTAIGKGRGDWAADVAVEIETLIYAVAAIAVFAVAVAAVVAGKTARLDNRPIYREIFFTNREIAHVADALTLRAKQIRQAGQLR